MMRLRSPLLPVLLILLTAYAVTMQTIPNGSDHYFMIDVGETQVVLNVWGTLHATGYPVYVMTGSALTGLLTLFGVSPAIAPGLVSLLWGLLALVLMYRLMVHLTGSPLASALAVLLYGLTRTVWIHHVVAEIYTFELFTIALLYLLALWRDPVLGRIYWLALIGGVAVGHHRAVVMLIPALLYAVWPLLAARENRALLPRWLLGGLLLGLAGALLPYAYLVIRAGAPWVYGEPGTLPGLWDQFIGTEAARFIGPPVSLADNIALVNDVLLTDLTLPGLLLGLAGLVIGLRYPRYRRAALSLLLGGLLAYLFHALFYSDVLSGLILIVTFALAFGWLFLLDWLLVQAMVRRMPRWGVTGLALAAALALIALHGPFIRTLTSDPTGLETIRRARYTPAGSTLMIPWGMRHFAVGFARDVQRDPALLAVTLVDHKGELTPPVMTLPETLYSFPPDWWAERLGGPVYLSAPMPHIIHISTETRFTDTAPPGVRVQDHAIACTLENIILRVDWAAGQTPDEDLRVFVHLLDSRGGLIAQADQAAPVYGWRPLTGWQPGEVIVDAYELPRLPGAERVRYGLYRVLDGGFENAHEFEHEVICP